MLQVKKKAFSLIELMVVVAIVAVLASIIVPAYNIYVLKAKASKAYPVIKQVLDQYVTLHYAGKLPTSGSTILYTNYSGNDDNPIFDASVLNNSDGFSGPTPYVIFFDYQSFPELNDASVIVRYYPDDSSGVITWACSGIVANVPYSSGPSYSYEDIHRTFFPQCD